MNHLAELVPALPFPYITWRALFGPGHRRSASESHNKATFCQMRYNDSADDYFCFHFLCFLPPCDDSPSYISDMLFLFLVL